VTIFDATRFDALAEGKARLLWGAREFSSIVAPLIMGSTEVASRTVLELFRLPLACVSFLLSEIRVCRKSAKRAVDLFAVVPSMVPSHDSDGYDGSLPTPFPFPSYGRA